MVRGLVRSAGTGLDPLVAAFKATTGATDVSGTNAVIAYARTQGLQNNVRLFPMRDETNYGSGSIVAGVGGRTTNDMTLVNGPTWDADGIELDGSSQYGTVTIPDVKDSDYLYVFTRHKPFNASTPDGSILPRWSFGSSNANRLASTGGTISLSGETWALIHQSTPRLGSNSITWSSDEDFVETTCNSVGGTRLWKNQSEITINLSSGMTISTDTSPSSTSSSDDIIDFGSITSRLTGAPSYWTGTKVAQMVCDVSLTDAQILKFNELMLTI
jgi:hypothetical protein